MTFPSEPPASDTPFDPDYLESIAPDEEIEAERCTCTLLGPDRFGNYDQVVNPSCPLCGGG